MAFPPLFTTHFTRIPHITSQFTRIGLCRASKPGMRAATTSATRAAPARPVLVVGGGPVGFSLFLLLAKYGVKSLLVERGVVPTDHPQAHFVNYRTMEILRGLGPQGRSIETQILERQPPLKEWRTFTYCTGMLNGTIIGQIDHFAKEHGQIPKEGTSPTQVAHFSQNRLMTLLWDEAERVCAENGWHFGQLDGQSAPEAGVVLGRTFRSLVDRGDAVEASFVGNAPNELLSITAGTVAACDGAHSAVRNALGIPLEGKPGMQHLINIHFRSRTLGKLLRERSNGNRASMLYFVFNTRAIVVVVAHDLTLGEFVAQVPYYPPSQLPEDFNEARCRELISAAVFGASQPDPSVLADLTLHTVRPWAMSALVAQRYQQGNVVLVGDAAHQFPPAGGFGMNTGIGDAHNLAWKLALSDVRQNKMKLLASYEKERKPIAEANADLSVRNFSAATAVPSSLGLDPTAADLLVGSLNILTPPLIPRSARKFLLDGAMSLARNLASDSLLDESTTVGRARLEAARRILRDGKSLRLLFPRQDLGFVYGKRTKFSVDDLEYVPSWEAGARMPHIPVRMVSSEATSEEISSLDIIAKERRPAFFVLSKDEKILESIKAASGLETELVSVLLVSTDGSSKGFSADYTAVDVEGKFPDVAAAIVRPDGHIICLVRKNEELQGTLKPALARYFG